MGLNTYHSFDAVYFPNSIHKSGIFIKLPEWLHVYLYSINVYAQMNYIFVEFCTLEIFVTLYSILYF